MHFLDISLMLQYFCHFPSFGHVLSIAYIKRQYLEKFRGVTLNCGIYIEIFLFTVDLQYWDTWGRHLSFIATTIEPIKPCLHAYIAKIFIIRLSIKSIHLVYAAYMGIYSMSSSCEFSE